ncbi:MAG TPA: helix-turn-helix domain-containing protein [Pseudonocardiaceae bacterium]|jgi:AcrR family transcriptional regulator|nr:helix-turn-helix domain-containing protein [Pseudonocardiaceae bacterium]
MTQDTLRAAVTRPLRRDAERNRRRIIAAAMEVFRDRGLDATLDDVAHHAGLGVGTVYRRFPNKEALVEAMFAERLDQVSELADAALLDLDPWNGLVGFLWRAVELMAGDRGLRDILLCTAFGLNQVAEARDRLIPTCYQLIERAQESGQLRADLEKSDFLVIFKMLSSVSDYSHDVSPELWRRYLGVLLDGMRATPGPPSPLSVPPLDDAEMESTMACWNHPRH